MSVPRSAFRILHFLCRLLAAGCWLLFSSSAGAARIKDLAQVEGFRSNQLFGYGLIVGLEGTGDRQKTEFTVQALTNLLQDYRIRVRPEDVRVKNVAAVMVTVEVPPYAQPGARLDAIASSIGDAQSLSGGTLLLTPLRGPDGQVYAVAQGPLSLGGGFSANGIGARITKNHQTVGRITGGALLERPMPTEAIAPDGVMRIHLRQPDFTTAQRVAEAINAAVPDAVAHPQSPGEVTVSLPPGARTDPVAFVASLESLNVAPDTAARVVVNERTGTVVMGQDVRLAPVAIAHGGLHITIKTELGVSQPQPFSNGQTVIVPDTSIVIEEPKDRQLVEIPGGKGVSLKELVLALNSLGVTPRDLIAVFEALREAGALQAELVIM
ncbi:MAG TPA: flagellar basal body P-ring protein FlgI [Methylomirabilota bacterium]|jgi:flagellar P-ring protein precursor FlgI|nr:flagellar basal body P-ring protein FlgI [Methylomirabilota bacterium]